MVEKRKGIKQFLFCSLTMVFVALLLFPAVYAFSISLQDEYAIYKVKPQFLPERGNDIGVVLNYDNVAESEIEKAFWQDATVVMMSTYKEQKKENVTAIRVYAEKDGKIIGYVRAHTTKLQLEADYGVFKKASLKQKILTKENRYTQLMENLDCEFNLKGVSQNCGEGLDTAEAVELTDLVEEQFLEKYDVQADIRTITVEKSLLQLLEKYVGYFQMPKYMFGSYESIAKWGLFAFAFNTILTTVWAMLCQVVIPAVTAYPIAILFKKKTATFVLMFFLITMMIPFVSIMVPQMVLLKSFGMYDNYWAMLFPWLLPSPFYILLYKSFFQQIPGSLFEAARMDGANELFIFTKICVPLSKSIIAIIAIQSFISGWSDFFWYYLSTNSASLWTLNVAIFQMSNSNAIKQNFLMGVAIVTIIPIFLVTLLFSKQLKGEVMSSAVKG